MIAFTVARVLQAIVVLVAVTLAVFLLQHLLPGSEARAILGLHASQAQVLAFNRANGLNQPLVLQYLDYLWRLLHGDLGYSYKLNESVTSLLANDIPNDLVIVVPALLLSLAVAIPVGVRQAVRRNKAFDFAATGVAFLLYSMPSFWLGLLLVGWLAVGLRWLPAEAPQASSVGGVIAHPAGLVLPILTLALVNIALFSRYVRSSVLETLTQEYVVTARAKGLGWGATLRRHVLRNSMVSVVTLLGLSLPAIFTVGLVVEQIFNLNGTGLAFYTAASNQDYPVELGILLLVGVLTVLGNALADIGYAVLDPRVRDRRR
ncbi:MAG: ABC transporter permease [Streptosporangiaceae bacterium]